MSHAVQGEPQGARFITLEDWLRRTYGIAVTIATARRWVREGRIHPTPQKHGRSYFVTPDARYTGAAAKDDIIERLRRDYANAAPSVTH